MDKGFIAESAIGTAGATTLDHFRVVQFGTGPERATLATGVNSDIIGIAQQPVVTADVGKQAIDVRILGISKAVAGVNNIAPGQRLIIDAATGRVTNAAGAAGNRVVGIAMTGSTTIGDLVDVLLTPGVRV